MHTVELLRLEQCPQDTERSARKSCSSDHEDVVHIRSTALRNAREKLIPVIYPTEKHIHRLRPPGLRLLQLLPQLRNLVQAGCHTWLLRWLLRWLRRLSTLLGMWGGSHWLWRSCIQGVE